MFITKAGEGGETSDRLLVTGSVQTAAERRLATVQHSGTRPRLTAYITEVLCVVSLAVVGVPARYS